MFKKLAFLLVAPATFAYSMEVTKEELCSLLNDKHRSNPEAITAITSLSDVQKKLLGALLKDDAQKLISFFRECTAGKPENYQPLAVLFENIVRCDKILKFEQICLFITRLKNSAILDFLFKPHVDKAFANMILEGTQLNSIETIRFLLENGIPVPDIYIAFEDDQKPGHTVAMELPLAAERLGYRDLMYLLMDYRQGGRFFKK